MSFFNLSTGAQTLAPSALTPALTVNAVGGGGTLQLINGSSNTFIADANGNINLTGNIYKNGVYATEFVGSEQMPPYMANNVIERENLYTWFADQVISTTEEPFKATATYTRMQVAGSATFTTTYYSSINNGQYMIGCSSLTQDTTGTLETPTNYIKLCLPCKRGVNQALFLKFMSRDRWSSVVAYVCNQTFTTFKRLQGQTNSQSNTNIHPRVSWIGPNGQLSSSPQSYHEWLMFSIPQYWVDTYSYVEPNDTKSKYGTTINIAFCRGINNTHPDIWLSGIAMRPNPYGLTFHGALPLYWATNAGTSSGWYGDWNSENLMLYVAGTNYNHIRVPICPPKDPLIYALPDFYLVFITNNDADLANMFLNTYLQNPNDANDVRYLGQFSPCIRGRYGSRLVDAYRYATGLIVASPESKYIVYVGGRPYLNLRINNAVPGGYGADAGSRGFFTEVVDSSGARGFTPYTSTPISYTT